MEITRVVCGAVADSISNSFYSHLYEVPGEDTQLDLLRLLYISPIRNVETAAFDKANEYSFKGT